MTQESVIEKVRKLLALSDSPNENEAKAAMKKAQALLARYKMSMKDVEDKETEVVTHYTGIMYSGQKNYWKFAVMNTLAKHHCVGVCNTHEYGKKRRQIVLMGEQEDIDVCMELFDYVCRYINAYMKSVRKKYGKSRTAAEYTKIETSYGCGFADGLDVMFQTQKEQNKAEWGLVMVVPKEVDDFIKGLKKKKIRIHDSGEARHGRRGYSDGLNTTFSDKLKEA